MALLLGLDIGTSSIKASLLDPDTGKEVASATSPGTEMSILSVQPGFAEQNPDDWWQNVCLAIQAAGAASGRSLREVQAIGITYQMHGLVLTDKAGRPVRPSIIWCDSRAVPYGERAYQALGENYCRTPAQFTRQLYRRKTALGHGA